VARGRQGRPPPGSWSSRHPGRRPRNAEGPYHGLGKTLIRELVRLGGKAASLGLPFGDFAQHPVHPGPAGGASARGGLGRRPCTTRRTPRWVHFRPCPVLFTPSCGCWPDRDQTATPAEEPQPPSLEGHGAEGQVQRWTAKLCASLSASRFIRPWRPTNPNEFRGHLRAPPEGHSSTGSLSALRLGPRLLTGETDRDRHCLRKRGEGSRPRQRGTSR